MNNSNTGAGEPTKKRLTTSAMIASIAAEGQATRAAPFGHALAALAEQRADIVGLSADLSKYTDLHIFAKAHPERFYQMGMAEQLLMSAAAGMAREGFVPFATTYAVFASRRAYDFICMAIAVENLMIVDPCDAVEIEQAVPAIAAHQGPVYMRLLRGNVPVVLDEYGYTFEIGKAKTLRTGRDVLIISTGLMTMRSLDAAKTLQADGVDVAVLHVPTIKPLDEHTILAEARQSGRLVVTAENSSIIGGLGEAVAGLLLRNGVTPTFRQIALPDAFLDAGALPTLHDRYGISTEAVCAQIKAWL
ncbi:transketolase C-terminal domain-containing protein [Pseudomonas sp.]|uniref:transketolase family protein n=1 Tax=Pseudomonas sp. TaxID=306 RepID=UPI0028ABF05E|nr:transketolase C-terminal domain-containing protein [Pseudomonas sp.]